MASWRWDQWCCRVRPSDWHSHAHSHAHAHIHTQTHCENCDSLLWSWGVGQTGNASQIADFFLKINTTCGSACNLCFCTRTLKPRWSKAETANNKSRMFNRACHCCPVSTSRCINESRSSHSPRPLLKRLTLPDTDKFRRVISTSFDESLPAFAKTRFQMKKSHSGGPQTALLPLLCQVSTSASAVLIKPIDDHLSNNRFLVRLDILRVSLLIWIFRKKVPTSTLYDLIASNDHSHVSVYQPVSVESLSPTPFEEAHLPDTDSLILVTAATYQLLPSIYMYVVTAAKYTYLCLVTATNFLTGCLIL